MITLKTSKYVVNKKLLVCGMNVYVVYECVWMCVCGDVSTLAQPFSLLPSPHPFPLIITGLWKCLRVSVLKWLEQMHVKGTFSLWWRWGERQHFISKILQRRIFVCGLQLNKEKRKKILFYCLRNHLLLSLVFVVIVYCGKILCKGDFTYKTPRTSYIICVSSVK